MTYLFFLGNLLGLIGSLFCIQGLLKFIFRERIFSWEWKFQPKRFLGGLTLFWTGLAIVLFTLQ